MVRWPEAPELRRCALAVAVLHDIDVLPAIDGIVLTGTPAVEVSWAECRRALGGVEPETDDGRHRLARWLLLRRWLADRPLEDLVERARPFRDGSVKSVQSVVVRSKECRGCSSW